MLYRIALCSDFFLISGYYSCQPFFDDLFLNFLNIVNEDVGNEGVLGLKPQRCLQVLVANPKRSIFSKKIARQGARMNSEIRD